MYTYYVYIYILLRISCNTFVIFSQNLQARVELQGAPDRQHLRDHRRGDYIHVAAKSTFLGEII